MSRLFNYDYAPVDVDDDVNVMMLYIRIRVPTLSNVLANKPGIFTKFVC